MKIEHRPIYSSLRVCRHCDKVLSIAEDIEDFCDVCRRGYVAVEATAHRPELGR
jgi:hypothetical protein